jgi:hypothetical protein
MSTTNGGPNNVNNGLSNHLDAANRKSYVSNVFPYPLDGYSWATSGYQMTITRDNTTTSPVGTSPLKIVTSGTSAYTNTYGSSGSTLAPSSQGKTWTFSFWVKGSSSFSASMLIFESNTSGNYITYGQPFYNVTTEWTRVSGTYTMTQATAAGVQVRIDCYVNGVTLWVDGFQLERTTTLSTFSSKVNTNGANINDLTPNINNGTIVNGLGYSSSNNGSIVFNGVDDYITMNYVGTGNIFTHEVFLKPTNASKDQMYIGYNNYTAHYVRIVNSAAFLSVSTTVSQRTLAHTQTLLNNNIYHIVSTYDGIKLKIYVNNQLVEGTSLNESLNGWGISRVGRWLDADQRSFVGDIYLIKSYNRALSAQEILQNYNAQKSRFGLP